jgi:alanine transaminase
MNTITRRLSSSLTKVLNKSTVNPHLIQAEYAVRGYIPTLASEIAKQIKIDPKKYDFNQIVQLNIGNPLVFNTKPIWTFRQIVGDYLRTDRAKNRLTYMHHSSASNYLQSHFPEFNSENYFGDFDNLGIDLQKNQPNFERTPLGGYLEAKKSVADMISVRDGFPADPTKIFLSNGASSAIRLFFDFLITDPSVGILIPIPQYPLYSALITLFNGQGVPYYLDEANNWNITIKEVEKSYEDAIAKGIKPKAIVLINPGNPTGNVFDRNSMEQIVEFAHKKNLILLADEVYQENVYGEKPWYSFKKVLKESPSKIANELELVSFHSLSKGILGECGIRGGYVEMTNMDPAFTSEFERIYSLIWPNAVGQAILNLKCKFLSGDLDKLISKETMIALRYEYQQAYDSLRFRANAATNKLNEAINVQCNPIEGAMYAFPQIKLSPRFIKAAEAAKLKPDVFYCKTLLERTGICLVPGSGFGQQEGTFHFRTTILPSPDNYFTSVFEKFKIENDKLMQEYS